MTACPPPALTPNGFPLHDEKSAAEPVNAALAAFRARSGFLPNYAALLGHSPLLWQAYSELNRLFAASSFSPTERQVVMLTASAQNGCAYCVAAHSTSARKQGIDSAVLESLRAGQPLSDPRLEILRCFTLSLLAGRGEVSAQELADFLAAGYSREQALELLVALALKVVTNYSDRLAELPLDEQYAAEAWDEQRAG